jgi:hypothetical protein
VLKNVFFIVCMFGFSACRINLFPELVSTTKYSASFPVKILDPVCEVPEATIYFSGLSVSDPFQGKRVILESESGRYVLLDTVEWGARFVDLFNQSYENGIRKAFRNYRSIQLLAAESGVASTVEVSFRLISHELRRDKNTQLAEIESKGILRILHLLDQKEVYYNLQSTGKLEHADEEQIMRVVRLNLRKLSSKSYRKLEKELCLYANM